MNKGKEPGNLRIARLFLFYNIIKKGGEAMDDIVAPLIILPDPQYVEPISQEVYDDYFGQWIRGSEGISGNVQYHGAFDG